MGKKYFVGDEVMRSFDCVIVGREFLGRCCLWKPNAANQANLLTQVSGEVKWLTRAGAAASGPFLAVSRYPREPIEGHSACLNFF